MPLPRSDLTPQSLLARIVNEFEKRGWREGEDVALQIVREIEFGGRVELGDLARRPSRTFLAKNKATRTQVREALDQALAGTRLQRSRLALISIDEIDTFSAVASVPAKDVAMLAAQGLPLPEAKVKEYIASIVGEPYLDSDWGGELSDISTTRVILGGRRVTAAFLLKGAGAPVKLRPRNLGKNGDQIRRLSKQAAELFVVQHVGSVDEAVRDMLDDMVVARRAEGNSSAVGSIWDGVDCARLFVAHDLIDPSTGVPRV